MYPPWQERYLHRFYAAERGWVDGTTEFHHLCRQKIPHSARILEVGAGPSNDTSRFLAGIGELRAVDPDEAVLRNDAVRSAAVLREGVFPYDQNTFDACVSSFVLEHVTEPIAHLREVRRILKPGAPYIFRTPNVRHFIYFIAARTPHRFHVAVSNRLRKLPKDAHDPYPTIYAMNSSNAIRDLAGEAGFAVEVLRLIEKEPSYGMASRALFIPLMLYERTVNATDRLSDFRAVIVAVLR